MDILILGYDARNTVIVDYSKQIHICNGKGNCIIIELYNFHNVNENLFLDRLWPYLFHLNGVSDVRSIVKSMELVC